MRVTPIYLKHDLKEIPEHGLPEGFKFVAYKKGYEKHWASMLVEAGEFNTTREAVNRFKREFAWRRNLEHYMIFIENDKAELVGTVTAWYGTIDDTFMGRLHWFEVIPDYQGLGLGRPLLCRGMRLLKGKHDEAFIKTRQRSVAIHLYMSMGWTPFIVHPAEMRIWNKMGINADAKVQR